MTNQFHVFRLRNMKKADVVRHFHNRTPYNLQQATISIKRMEILCPKV